MPSLAKCLFIICCVGSVQLLYSPAVSHAQQPFQVQSQSLSEDALNAYLESLQFCLVEIGEMAAYTPELEARLRQNIRQNFSYLPQETQLNLINARSIWSQYQSQWAFLNIDQKKEFGFAVLGLAFGEEAAAQALGMGQSGSSSFNGVDVDSIGGGCTGGHCETVGGTVEIDPN
ncbi:hypothetical protein [uncultured Pseudoteredinibacter sp.]|uniref:hypothetical protein n=1 Tax=uncultured Pseudoteredinibacter sp. TaxID=1641701 RepID=UPI002604C7FF|nr:hypothetical protein [uncultured Pseudoteredinibacter sp.]